MRPPARRGEPPAGLRRRRFTAPHRRRRLAVRLLRPFAAALVVVAAPVAAAGWLLQGPQLRLRTIEVSGTERVSREWIGARVEPLRGRHLLGLSLAELESELGDHPWIAGVAMRKRLPDTLSLRVVERRPVALLRSADSLHYVDRDGRVIDRYDPRLPPRDLLLVRAAPEAAAARVAAALAAAREFARVEPGWGAELSEVEVVGEGDLKFYTAALPFALLLGAGGIETGLRRLRRHLPEVQRRFATAATLDLRFGGRIVVVPAMAPQREEG